MELIFKQKLGSNFYAESYVAYAANESEVLYRVKVVKPQFLDKALKSYLQQQLEYLQELNIEGLRLPELLEVENAFLIKYAFHPQATLGEYLRSERTLSVEKTLQLGISLCEGLANRHLKTWVHRGLKPNNIFYSSAGAETLLFDDLALVTPNRLSRLITDPAYCRDSIPYQSPEQCGQVRLVVDYRSDLYSLGCVLYHCISGAPPFTSTKPQELIHSHLAEIPPALAHDHPQCPIALSHIIATLLDKQTEKRYQTAQGLKKDLQTCLERLAKNDTSDFPLKSGDFSREIVLPSILVGRNQEKQQLLDLFQEVNRATLGLAFVSGLSGIGKSRLVQELEVPILEQQGLFTSGKYNQFSMHQPYATLAQAIGKLIRQILTETSAQLESWKHDILDVVGINGQLLQAVIPELSLLIGPQPDVNSLPPIESRNRFNDLFCRFITCLATQEHPLVIFIDDLQWCDDATFDVLELLFSQPQKHAYLLLILAFRSNEVNDKHRIHALRRLLEKTQTALLEVDLGELDKSQVNEMTAYILNCSPLESQSITAAIHPSCGGNPLLVGESLRWLHQRGGIFHDTHGRWNSQQDALNELQLPASFLQLFTDKLSQLPTPSQQLLAAAALLGERFKTSDLAALQGLSPSELMTQLAEIFTQRILIKDKSDLCFAHDQIQTAAAKLLSPDAAIAVHQQIAQLLLQQLREMEAAEQDNEQVKLLYLVAEHLKKSRDQHAPKQDKFAEATINFRAGEAALKSLAHNTAHYYFSEAVHICPTDHWAEHYAFMLSLYKCYARSALLVGEQGRSNEIIEVALQHAASDLDRADCLLEQIVATISQGHLEESLVLGQRCCALLGNPLPEGEAAISAEIATHSEVLNDPLIVERYRQLSMTSSQKIQIELSLYTELLTIFYLTGRHRLYFVAGMRSTIIALQHGTTKGACFSLNTVCNYFHLQKNYRLAEDYQNLVLELAAEQPYEFSTIRAITQALWLTMHHNQTIGELQILCRSNIKNGLRAGELNYTGLSYTPLVWYQMTQGADIGKLQNLIQEGIAHCEQFSITSPLEICRASETALAPLWGELPPGYEDGVEQKIQQWHAEQHLMALCNFYYTRAIVNFYSGEYAAAERDLLSAEPFLSAIPSTVVERLWGVYRYLTGLHTGNNPDAAAQLAEVGEASQYGPLLRPLLCLMQAEATAQESNSISSLRNGYWQAIDSAHEHGYCLHEAYAYQRLGEALALRQHHSSHFHLNEAVRLYQKCNASVFADKLCERFQLLSGRTDDTPATASASPLGQNLDKQFLLDATENIMKERDYDALLLKILVSLMARVGAQNAYLIILEGEALTIRAHGRKNVTVETRRLNQDIEGADNLCPEIVRFVLRSQAPVVLANALKSADYSHSPAVQHFKLKSVLALPLVVQSRTLGLIYLENSLIANVFSDEQVSLLQVLTAQAAIALDNSLLIADLQHTQENLIQREQNLSITLNSIGDGVIVTDRAGHVTRLNPIAEQLTGWSIAEAEGKPVGTIFNIVDAETRQALVNPAQKVLASGEIVTLSNHTTLIAKDGSEYHIADSAAPIRNGDDSILGMVLVFNDVTEAYHLRQEVADNHLRQEQILGDMRSMVATLNTEGKIQFVNKTPLSLAGLYLEDAEGRALWDCFWFSHDQKTREIVHQACKAAARGREYKQDIQMRTLDGPLWIAFSLRPIKDERGNINLIVAEGSDISSRKLAEQTLKDEKVLQALTLDNLAEAVILSNQHGIIQHFNASACQMFGYSEQEVSGQAIITLIDNDDVAKFEDYRRTLHRSSTTGINIRAKRKNGEVFPFHIAIAELPEIKPGETQFVASGQDLTDIELQQEMLQRSQKMDALGKLTGGIAHDYNNMLGVVQGYCELLEPVLAENLKHTGFLNQIQHAADRGTKLTQKLLSYSRQKPAQTELTDINELLLSQQELLEKTLTARIQINLKLDKKTPIININTGDFEDAIFNICINAMHAMPDGGRLRITVKEKELSPQDAEALQINSGVYAVLSITDSGTGMDKETQSKIFDPFFSSKGERGTGLGLSQVYGFMERSQGTIKVYSELGVGSRFSLYFPLEASARLLNINQQSSQDEDDLSGTASILVVDDEPALVGLMSEVLKSQGYIIFTAENADDAMKIVRTQAIDLVLSDIIMPKTNGYQLAKNVQDYNQNIIIQLMSGFDDELNIDGSNYSLHAEQLIKPIKVQTLLKRVKSLLDSPLNTKERQG